jgi:ACR3 family arsenite efflux pump ArsB
MAEEYITKPGGIPTVENSVIRITKNTVILVTLPLHLALISRYGHLRTLAPNSDPHKQRQRGIKAYEHPKSR